MQRARPFDMIALRLSALALAIAVGLLLAGVAAAAPSRAAENGNLLRSGQAQALQPERAVTLPVVHTKRAAAVQSKSVASELSAPIYVTQYSQPSCQSTNGIFSVVTRLPGSCISLNGGTYYIQLGSCDYSGSLWFDYYADSACTVTLAGSPGYPSDGTYHTTKVNAQTPCVTLPNSSNNVFALSCTLPVPSTTVRLDRSWTIDQFTDAQCTRNVQRTTGKTDVCEPLWGGPSSRMVSCFQGGSNTYFHVVDYVGQPDCPSGTLTATNTTGEGTVGEHGEASACSQVQAGVYVKVSCPSSSIASAHPALFTAAVVMLFGVAAALL